jgi:hypothetical protein
VILQRAGIVIAPMGIGEVLDSGFTLAKRNYRPLAIVGAWGAIPSYAALAIGGALGSGSRPSLIALSVILSILGGVGVVLMGAVVAIACSRLVHRGENEEQPTENPMNPADLYARAALRLGPMILLGIVCGLLAIPLVILFPLGIFLFGRWMMAYVVVILESVGPLDALRRSWQLTRGSWWHTVLTALAGGLVTGIVAGVMGGIVGAVAGILGALTGSAALMTLFATVMNGIPTILVEPFSSAILVVLYYELRARSEGFDLSQRVAQMAATA